MTYPENFECKIGFDKIRELIIERCLSPLGKECVKDMIFSSQFEVVSEQLDQVNEFVQILQGEREFPSGYFIDVRHPIKRIRPEGTYLDEKELFDLKRSLQTIYDIIRFFKTDENEEVLYPTLTALTGNIPVFPELIKKIDGLLDKYGKIKDQASPELAQIRKDINATISSVSRNLQNILKSAQTEGIVDKDISPTMRDGRLVIPVAPAFKRKIRGIVHDESATGKTVFIEPEAVVEANNLIRELESKERREILRILTEFANAVRPLVPDILHSYAFLAEIDFIRAKAIFSLQIHAIRPVVDSQPQIEWELAVHPLLFLSHQKQNKPVVPLDIHLNQKERILIISGPNAGGKSVCLKTVGLLQYMLQCGLLIPLKETSRIGLFANIFIDIGDEQSIENDLSTYSSHLTNMKFFVRNSTDRTLLLIDEFGSGTEPLIGGAIAEALLKRFNQSFSYGVITTHYQNLKHYAEHTDGVMNGAMLYDRHLMKPLFKLSIGHPGSSFAVEIARKIGLPDDVIEDASQIVGSDYIEMDKYLQDIVRDKRYWENKRQNIRQQEKKLEELTAQYEQALETVTKQRKEILNVAKVKAEQIVVDANAKIENTIREIKEAQAEKEKTKLVRQSLEQFKNTIQETGEEVKIPVRLNKIDKKQNHKKQTGKKEVKPVSEIKPLAIGDSVRMIGQQTIGTITDLKNKQAVVIFGMIKSTVKVSQLERTTQQERKKEATRDTFAGSQAADSMYEKKLNFKLELDVRGMRGDEALQAVTYFIDDAIQTNANRVRILHGTGTGILRELIRTYLHTVNGVKRFQDEHVQFGGAGVTVVEID